VTYDFARLMPGAKQVSCSAFGEAMIKHMAGASAKAVRKSSMKSARRAAPAKKKVRRR
jgi:hypothetical protein